MKSKFIIQLLKNFKYLSLVNLINIAAPLVIIPWLIHRVGLDSYGILAFHQYFGQFVLMFIDFGFSVYAVNEVSNFRFNKKNLSNFICSVYVIKAILAVIVVIVCSGILMVEHVNEMVNISPVIFIGFIANSILSSLYPGWFYQGVEEIEQIIFPTLFSRVTSLGFIVTFVNEPNDIWLVPIAYCLGGLMLLVTAFGTIKNNAIDATSLSSNEIFRIAKEALQVFWSRLIIMGYAAASPVLVKIAAGDAGVAIYSICEKIISLGRMPFDMYANAAYPRLAQNYDKAFVQKLIKRQFIVALIAVTAALAAGWIVRSHLDALWASSLKYFSVYLVALIPIAMHSFIGTCVLMVNGHRLILSTSILFGLMGYLASYAMGGWLFEDQILRIITSMVMVEYGILFVRYLFARRLKLI